MAGGEIQGLPEGCISHIISLTSPVDACRLAAVSPIFRSAAGSDSVWERFLPSDISEIASRAVHPVEHSSKKELFFRLCRSILIDGGAKSFALERSSGKKCFLLSARELTIIWGDAPQYWQWISAPESRIPSIRCMFSEVALLLNVCWLEIRGRINCGMLSQKTSYAAHLVFKITADSYGLEFPQKASIELGTSKSEKTVRLRPAQPQRRSWWGARWPLLSLVAADPGLPAAAPAPPPLEQEGAPRGRDGGWMEVEIGRFFCGDGGDGEVVFSVTETSNEYWKRGLLVEGIEVRPAS